MTRSPVCPACGSTAVTSDASNGGAGRNVCHCGHRAPVRDFYAKPAFGTFGKFAEKPLEPITAEQYSKLYMQSPEYFPIPDGYKWDNKTGTIIPKPGRVNYVIIPNGELNDMRHTREPAPIRQYKDD